MERIMSVKWWANFPINGDQNSPKVTIFGQQDTFGQYREHPWKISLLEDKKSSSDSLKASFWAIMGGNTENKLWSV